MSFESASCNTHHELLDVKQTRGRTNSLDLLLQSTRLLRSIQEEQYPSEVYVLRKRVNLSSESSVCDAPPQTNEQFEQFLRLN